MPVTQEVYICQRGVVKRQEEAGVKFDGRVPKNILKARLRFLPLKELEAQAKNRWVTIKLPNS